MSDAFLVAKGLSKVYKNGTKEVRAVDGVNLEINKGGSLAVTGPSGAGKSTLLHLLGALDTPTSGEVMLDGVDINRLSDRDRAGVRNRRVGFVFQFYHLLPEFSALENVMMPALIRGKDAKAGAIEALRLVGLEDRMDHRPGELSGGESQRVAIARSLINGPEALLCDEPTGNLDSKNGQAVLDLLFDIKSKTGMALVIVTHDENLAARTDRIIHLRDGKLA